MNRQPSFNLAVLQMLVASAVFVGASANAQSYVTDPESGASVSVTSTVSRAEVLADLKIYQESGLAAAERAASETGQETQALRTARQRYAALRQSDRYTALVAEYAARRGDVTRPAAKV